MTGEVLDEPREPAWRRSVAMQWPEKKRLDQRLEAVLGYLEGRRGGRWWAAAFVGLALFALAAVYVTPATKCINYGCAYAEVARDLWTTSPSNAVRLRWLTPLIADTLGLQGRSYILLPMAMMVALLAAIFAHYRRIGFGRGSSFGMSAAIAFSTCSYFILHFPGYVDPTSYLLQFAAMILAGRPWLWPLIGGAAVLNHESNIVMFPWMILLTRVHHRRGPSALVAAAWSVVVVFASLKLRSVAMKGGSTFSVEYYLNPSNVSQMLGQTTRLLPIGAFMAFKLLWWLPLAAIGLHVRRRRFLDALVLVAIVLGATAQIVVAGDTTRLFGAAFPAILLGAQTIRSHWGEASFQAMLFRLVGWSLMIPTFFIGFEAITPLLPLPVTYLFERVLLIPIPRSWWLEG